MFMIRNVGTCVLERANRPLFDLAGPLLLQSSGVFETCLPFRNRGAGKVAQAQVGASLIQPR